MKKLWMACLALLCLLPTAARADVLTLPTDLTVIEAEVFCGDTTIDRAVVPEGTLSVGRRAFEDSSLSEITLPESLTEIAEDAFDGCESLTVVNAIKFIE